jgi:hypothetical protein
VKINNRQKITGKKAKKIKMKEKNRKKVRRASTGLAATTNNSIWRKPK